MTRCYGKGEERGKVCCSCICVPKQSVLCIEGLLSRKGLMGSTEQIPLTALLVCTVFLLLSNGHYHDLQAFQPYSYFYSIQCEKGKSERLWQCLEVARISLLQDVCSALVIQLQSLCLHLWLSRETQAL